MNDETTDLTDSAANESGEFSLHESQRNSTNEGEIVRGTWVNPNVPDNTPQRLGIRRENSYALPEGRTSFVRAIFGSVVILTDELTDWASLSDEDDLPQQMAEAAVRQAMEQQESIAERPLAGLRYGTIGLLGGTLDAAQNGTQRITYLTDSLARTAGRFVAPLWNSFLFTPLHAPLMKAEQAGEEKVNEWVMRGRVEEVRSRALAEVGINNFVEESVTEIAANAQVQTIVQQVIASQSTGLLTEILEEIRERFVTLDLLLLGKIRREPVATPDFRDAYLSQLSQRHQQYLRPELNRSMAGTYAGPLARLVAFVIDVILLIITTGLISSLVSSTLALFGLTDLLGSYLFSGELIPTILLALILLSNFLILGFYFVLSWSLIGSTPGDLILGLRVVKTDGSKVSVWRSFLRLIGAVVSAVFLFAGFIWALFDSRRQGWHDKIAGTFVLYDWPAKPDEVFLRDRLTS